MRTYSIAKVTEDMGFAVRIHDIGEVKARNYEEAVDKATTKLHLKRGDKLSIIALKGIRPHAMGRYTYTI